MAEENRRNQPRPLIILATRSRTTQRTTEVSSISDGQTISKIQRMEKITQALKSAGLAIVQFIIWICTLPLRIASASRVRREQDEVDHAEAERLDRLRNPSNYIGK